MAGTKRVTPERRKKKKVMPNGQVKPVKVVVVAKPKPKPKPKPKKKKVRAS